MMAIFMTRSNFVAFERQGAKVPSRPGLSATEARCRPGERQRGLHFRDQPSPYTVAAFASGDEEGVAENEVARLALLV
jgi:hypothetical protein